MRGRIHRPLSKSCRRSRLFPGLEITLWVLFIFASERIPPADEPVVRELECVFLFDPVLILLATETIGERFCCCQEKNCLATNTQFFQRWAAIKSQRGMALRRRFGCEP